MKRKDQTTQLARAVLRMGHRILVETRHLRSELEESRAPTPLRHSGWSVKTISALERGGYKSVQDVQQATDTQLLAVKNFGPTALGEVRGRSGTPRRGSTPLSAHSQARLKEKRPHLRVGDQVAYAPPVTPDPPSAERPLASEQGMACRQFVRADPRKCGCMACGCMYSEWCPAEPPCLCCVKGVAI